MYPDRGAVVRDLPQGATGINYAGVSYRFAGGVWYEPRGPAYIVVAPPIGVIVPQLPAFASGFDQGGASYLYANDVFYRARPDLGGYEVVNDPEDEAPQQSQAPVPPVPAAPAVAAAPPVAVAPPAAAVPPVAAAPPPVAAAAAAVTPAAAVSPAVTAAPAVTPAPAVAPPPPQLAAQQPVAAATSTDAWPPSPGNPTAVAIQPRNGQSADQEASDRYECYRFAVAQTGFDPLAANGGSVPTDAARHGYARAQAACLEGRGYSMQ